MHVLGHFHTWPKCFSPHPGPILGEGHNHRFAFTFLTNHGLTVQLHTSFLCMQVYKMVGTRLLGLLICPVVPKLFFKFNMTLNITITNADWTSVRWKRAHHHHFQEDMGWVLWTIHGPENSFNKLSGQMAQSKEKKPWEWKRPFRT